MAASESNLSSIHVQPGIEARRWERFIINKPGAIAIVCPGLSRVTSRTCHVMDISRGGACIQVGSTIGMPDHYYLTFLGSEDRIGCAEVYRSGQRVGVRFIKTISEQLLSNIIRSDFLTR